MLFMLSGMMFAMTFTSCSKDDDETGGGNVVVIDTEETENGYYDGTLYYQITSNTSQSKEVTVYKCNSLATDVEVPSYVNIKGAKYKVVAIDIYTFSAYKYAEKDGPGEKLKTIKIPGTVLHIDENAFYDCFGLLSVNITDLDKWVEIDFGNSYSNPLYHAKKLYLNGQLITNAELKNANKIVGAAFRGCADIISVTIPSSVTSIGKDAFAGCTGLKSIAIPGSVTSIGEDAFSGCTGLKSIAIPCSVTNIGYDAFKGCLGLMSITVAKDNTKYDSRDNSNAIIETASNTLILGCKNTIIPNSVTSIGHDAFSYCSGLTSVTIPNSVTYIGNYAFSGCSGLTSITIPNSVTSIGYDAFYNCNYEV